MNYTKAILAATLSMLAISCVVQRGGIPKNYPKFYKEGHRGTRGLAPENTIIAMIAGIKAGANVIEVDVYTSKNGKVFISHDPSVNNSHTLTADGQEISKESASKLIFHQMDYADIAKFDVGSKYYPAFPQQKLVKASIPLLGDLIDSVERFTTQNHLKPVIFNIELKNSAKYDNVYNAPPAELVEAVMNIINTRKIGNRYYLQSFDYRPLQYIHQKYPKVTTALLTSNKLTLAKNLTDLGFNPAIYSPEFSLVTPEMIKEAHNRKMKLVPWVVNSTTDMNKQISMGVDGIITDYPDRLATIKP